MIKFLNTAIILGVLFSCSAALSEQYDLLTILNMADKNNKEIKLARAELKTAAAVKKEAWSTALPMTTSFTGAAP